jgi:RNA polymerase sigma-70 factor (ECF subfamily)
MPEDPSFRELIGRIRAGDQAAAAELVRRYEPTIRRTVRVRLRDARLGRLLDSMDISQSVLASFFVRTALGQFDLDSPEQLLKLLAAMARHKLANQAHHHQAQCRDYRRVELGPEGVGEAVAPSPGPYHEAMARELLAEGRRRLSDAERRLLEMRQEGRGWADIAQELGTRPEALRMQLTRAVDRVTRELGLDEVSHE